MKGITLGITIMFLLINCACARSAESLRSASPEEFVLNLYREYVAEYDKVYWFDDKEKLLRYFDSNLTELLLQDEQCKEKFQEICKLDYDPIIDAQDLDFKYKVNFEAKAKVIDNIMRCEVVFENITKRLIVYELKQTENGWRIADIKYSDGRSLTRLLRFD